MPARETSRLLGAIQEWLDAYGRDPEFAELAEQLEAMSDTIQSRAADEPAPEDTPGRREAREAQEDSWRRDRRELPEGEGGPPKSFSEARERARGRLPRDREEGMESRLDPFERKSSSKPSTQPDKSPSGESKNPPIPKGRTETTTKTSEVRSDDRKRKRRNPFATASKGRR